LAKAKGSVLISPKEIINAAEGDKLGGG